MRCLLRSSSPPRRHLHAVDAGQFSLPFAIEAEAHAIPVPAETVDGAQLSSPQFSPEQTSAGQESSVRDRGKPNRKENRGERKRAKQASLAPEAKLLVSRNVAAEMLSISVRSVDYMLARRQLSTRRIANRVLIPIEEIRKFARSDHSGRMAGSPNANLNHPNRKEVESAAIRELEDELPSASRSRRPPPAEMAYANRRYGKPTRTAACGEHRGDLPGYEDTG